MRYDVRITLLAAGLIFLLALVLGVWKYRQILVADDHHAHPYVDIAHRAALLYSFATLLIAAFVQFSAWPAWVNCGATPSTSSNTPIGRSKRQWRRSSSPKSAASG